MVRIHPDPPLRESARVQGWAVRRKGGPDGAVAQLGERLLCKQEVVGSIPSSSTSHASAAQQHPQYQHLSVAVSTQQWALWPKSSSESCSVL